MRSGSGTRPEIITPDIAPLGSYTAKHLANLGAVVGVVFAQVSGVDCDLDQLVRNCDRIDANAPTLALAIPPFALG
jgi:hypothetical protein